MKPSEVEKWMDENEKTATNIASALRVHTATIERFLKGIRVSRNVYYDLKRLVRGCSNQNGTPPEAA